MGQLKVNIWPNFGISNNWLWWSRPRNVILYLARSTELINSHLFQLALWQFSVQHMRVKTLCIIFLWSLKVVGFSTGPLVKTVVMTITVMPSSPRWSQYLHLMLQEASKQQAGHCGHAGPAARNTDQVECLHCNSKHKVTLEMVIITVPRRLWGVQTTHLCKTYNHWSWNPQNRSRTVMFT